MGLLMTDKGYGSRRNATLQGFMERVFIEEGADTLVDQMSFLYGYFVITCEGRLIAASKAFVDLLEYSLDEITGLMVVDLVVREDREELARRFALNISERYPIRLLTKSGGKKYVTVSPHLFYVSGKPHRIAHFIDNTDQINIQRELIVTFRNTASSLCHAIEQRDPYTYGHMSRTAYIAGRIGSVLQLNEREIEAIKLGAGLHDIGKISVPIEILTKPTGLVSHEWAFIKKHPEIGHDILADVNFDRTVKDIVLLHHERQDGSGYPFGLGSDDIPLETAIVGVADCLEAISGVRPYRKEHGFEHAIEIMESEREKHPKELLKIARHLVFDGKLEEKVRLIKT